MSREVRTQTERLGSYISGEVVQEAWAIMQEGGGAEPLPSSGASKVWTSSRGRVHTQSSGGAGGEVGVEELAVLRIAA